MRLFNKFSQLQQKINRHVEYALSQENMKTHWYVHANVLDQLDTFTCVALGLGLANFLMSQDLSIALLLNGLLSLVKCAKPIINIAYTWIIKNIILSKFLSLHALTLFFKSWKKALNIQKYFILFLFHKQARHLLDGARILISRYRMILVSLDIMQTLYMTLKIEDFFFRTINRSLERLFWWKRIY